MEPCSITSSSIMAMTDTTEKKCTEHVISDKDSECEVETEVQRREVKSNKNKEIATDSLPLEKKIKLKRSKIRTVRGEKRKFSGNVECYKKIKKKKKEESTIVTSSKSSNNDSINENKLLEPLETHNGVCDIFKQSDFLFVENGFDSYRYEKAKEKLKPASSRKVKAITNACRETLDVLIKFGPETLHSIDKSLKILKNHNVLDNKFISIDTLIQLIELALDTSRPSDEIIIEKEMCFSKIVSNLANCKTPKTSKARQQLLNSGGSPKTEFLTYNNIHHSNGVESETDISNKPVDKTEEQNTALEEMETDSELQKNTTDQVFSEKPGKKFITNYFKKLERSMEDKDKWERFNSFSMKCDMYTISRFGGESTDIRRKNLEEKLQNQVADANYLMENKARFAGQLLEKRKRQKLPEKLASNTLEVKVICDANTHDGIISKATAPEKTKAKLLQFYENRRPPYWGTWRRRSITVGPRRPFAKEKVFNYEIDSDDEWEGEEEPGESLHGSDDDREPEEDYEVDNDFFVPHGYLSDDENPEKENMPLNTKLNLLEEQFSSELKQKTRKMTPIVLGTFWTHKGFPPESNVFQDLQLEKLQYFPWTTCPIQIEEDEEKKFDYSVEQDVKEGQVKKPRLKATFPLEEVPNLIKIVHGSPQNCEQLARKFLSYWHAEKTPEGKRSTLTKKCVLNKIKELATWQASQDNKKCWQVSKETQKEFGTEIDTETVDKKPQKCYIWKFIKKGNKTTGLPSPVPQDPEVVVLES